MKNIFVIQMTLLLAFPLYAQYSSSWEKIDSVTIGECDDANPVLAHGTFNYGYSRPYQWLIFGRNTESSSEIVGKKFLIGEALWDSSVVIISSSQILKSQRNPDVSEISYPHNNFSRLAAWERRENSTWNIYYSRFTDNDSAWAPSQPLTHDSVDNTNVQIRPLSDSSFIMIWKRKSTLLYSFVNSAVISVPETIAVSTSDSLEFDITSNYHYGNLVWTSRDTTDKNIMIYRSFETYPTFTFTAPETLLYRQSAFNPRFTSMYYGNEYVFFEILLNGNREVMIWEGYSNQDYTVENISNDSLADYHNPRAFTNPVITKRRSIKKKSYYLYYDILTMEKYTSTDSMLIFSGDYNLSDTVKSVGYNRNVCIGSGMLYIDKKLFVLIVWESNRSGHSHIFSRLVRLYIDGVEPPKIPLGSFTLEQNFPNPFNPSTTLRYSLPSRSRVHLVIYNILGQLVADLVNAEQAAGWKQIVWNAGVSSGLYFYRLEAVSLSDPSKRFVNVKKMLLLK